jgi:hypothetical protein
MGVPVDPISEYDDIFENLRDLLAEITIANKAAMKLSDSTEKSQIISASDTAVRIVGDVFHNLQQAREKLSRRFW